MFKQKPFPFSMLVLVILIALHYAGSYYSWYWKFSFFDIIVHIFSGLWVALVLLWLASYVGQVSSLKEYKIRSFLIAFISAVLIGIVWELAEVWGHATSTNTNGYALDTAMDIMNDAVGGILAYLYFIRSRKCEDKSCDVLHPFYNQIGLNNK